MELEKNVELNDNIDVNVGIKGLGGWLILVGIGYFIGIIRQGILVKQAFDVYHNGTMKMLSNPQHPQYNSKLFWLVNMELIGSIVIIIVLVGALILFFSKKKIFPKYAIIFIVFSNLYLLLDIFMVDAIGLAVSADDISGATQGFISAAIWITYFIKSERVKNTFVN